jgi:hypothetical protein
LQPEQNHHARAPFSTAGTRVAACAHDVENMVIFAAAVLMFERDDDANLKLMAYSTRSSMVVEDGNNKPSCIMRSIM